MSVKDGCQIWEGWKARAAPNSFHPRAFLLLDHFHLIFGNVLSNFIVGSRTDAQNSSQNTSPDIWIKILHLQIHCMGPQLA